VSSIKLRVAEYLELAAARGHDTFEQQAAAAGLGVATIHRLRNGQPASATAVAAILHAYGCEFSDVFTLAMNTAEPSRARAAIAA
jgi:hypothetical protein